MVILIDNGHGSNTAGKRSPDGRLREYKYAREIAQDLCDSLRVMGYDARRIVTEETDVPLTSGKDNRVKRVNDVCKAVGKQNVLLVSIHCNAAGKGDKWLDARGWSAHVALKASENSKGLACCLAASGSSTSNSAPLMYRMDSDSHISTPIWVLLPAPPQCHARNVQGSVW